MPNLIMIPAPGERLVRYVGDTIRFSLAWEKSMALPEGWTAYLRTNLGRASRVREEILRSRFQQVAPAGESWHDIAMRGSELTWEAEVTLTEVGFFKAKAYAVDETLASVCIPI
jgi:starch synthase (maltosyl-transferring)